MSYSLRAHAFDGHTRAPEGFHNNMRRCSAVQGGRGRLHNAFVMCAMGIVIGMHGMYRVFLSDAATIQLHGFSFLIMIRDSLIPDSTHRAP